MLFVINLFLFFFLIECLIDGIVNYKLGFFIAIPILIFLLGFLILMFVEFYKKGRGKDVSGFTIAAFVILGLCNLFFYVHNVIVWLDLFDGKTEFLLP